MADRIESVAVVTVRAPLPTTIRFGQWVMTHREFILCRLRTEAVAMIFSSGYLAWIAS